MERTIRQRRQKREVVGTGKRWNGGPREGVVTGVVRSVAYMRCYKGYPLLNDLNTGTQLYWAT
jgi:hypothetical protein